MLSTMWSASIVTATSAARPAERGGHSLRRHEQRGDLSQADDLDLGAGGVASFAGIHDEAPVRSNRLTGEVETLLRTRGQPSLDLDGPAPAPRHVEHEIDLRSGGRPVETGGGACRRDREQVLDDEC